MWVTTLLWSPVCLEFIKMTNWTERTCLHFYWERQIYCSASDWMVRVKSSSLHTMDLQSPYSVVVLQKFYSVLGLNSLDIDYEPGLCVVMSRSYSWKDVGCEKSSSILMVIYFRLLIAKVVGLNPSAATVGNCHIIWMPDTDTWRRPLTAGCKYNTVLTH